jgi:PQQ-dependent dehydrogenase (methanol/ethanol family)
VAALCCAAFFQASADDAKNAAQVDGARIVAADDEPQNWLAHGRTYGEQRFSPLNQISTKNIGQLGLAWSYMTGTKRGLEATPLVVDGVMYTTGSWSLVYALDARTGRELWVYDPQVPKAKGRDACCDVVNRGVAVWKGRVYVATIDARLVALDARTGTPVWEVQTADPEQPYTITAAPRIVKDRVIIGNGGAEYGVRGYFSAYDAATGKQRWRFYTVPASKQGPHEHPELEQAAATWSARSLWESGLGGTVWDSMAYDPELDLLYVGVGNSSVYNRAIRSPGGGDNLFLASILAVRPETGELVWHYQTTPGEHWDYTAVQHMILADLEIAGRKRQVLMQAPKNGFFYVLDRGTGELLSAEKYTHVSWATHIDLASGRPVERPEASWSDEMAFVSPGPSGGHNWHPMAFSPRTGWVYIPSRRLSFPYAPDKEFSMRPHTFNTGEDWTQVSASIEGFESAARFCSPTHITAWDPVNQRQVWRADHDTMVPGGLLATAGDLLFGGNGTGVFSAYDARDGNVLWKDETSIGIIGSPVSYAVDGEQYVAVMVGTGGGDGIHRDLIDYVNDGRVLAWKLGGTAPMPPVKKRPALVVQAPDMDLEPKRVARGRALYARHCGHCHGMAVRNSTLLPDLRYVSAQVHADWKNIVLGGTRANRGMASFADVLDAEQADDIHTYVVSRATHQPTWIEQVALWVGEYACIPAEWTTD